MGPDINAIADDYYTGGGFEEVNLLSGLAAGPNFPSSGEGSVFVPSTRLGDSTRRSAFSLLSNPTNSSSTAGGSQPNSASSSRTKTQGDTPTTARASHPTLRKSFRKTLRTVSGFRVRMRTVFVPYVLLEYERARDRARGEGIEEGEDEKEKLEAGNEERTVVLCVEVENSGESGPGIGFEVEKVDVNIGGEVCILSLPLR